MTHDEVSVHQSKSFSACAGETRQRPLCPRGGEKGPSATRVYGLVMKVVLITPVCMPILFSKTVNEFVKHQLHTKC